MQRSALCRSRRELSNEYFLAKFGFDTAEKEPCKVCPLSAYRSPRFTGLALPFDVAGAVRSVLDAGLRIVPEAKVLQNLNCTTTRPVQCRKKR